MIKSVGLAVVDVVYRDTAFCINGGEEDVSEVMKVVKIN